MNQFEHGKITARSIGTIFLIVGAVTPQYYQQQPAQQAPQNAYGR